jgi:uncharacterized OsmC-like protein
MSKVPFISRKATVDVRKMIRKKLELGPELFSTTRVEAEIIRDHLMKAKISLPMGSVQYTIFADEPEIVGGHGSAPFMFGDFMASALLCELAQYIWNAAALDLVDKIHKVEMTLEGGFALAPLFVNDDAPGASTIREIKIMTRIEADATPEQVEQLAKLAAARCPAHQSLVNRLPYSNSVELNGQKIAEFGSE